MQPSNQTPVVVPSVQVLNARVRKTGPENGLLPPNDPLSAQDQHSLGEAGNSGTLISGGGFISFEEYNPTLTGRQGLKVYDEMRKNDATVSQSIKVVKNPILAAIYEVEAASEDPEHEMHAQFVRDNLMLGCIDFKDFLREALTMLDFGFSAAEEVMDFDYWPGYTHEEEIPAPPAPMPVAKANTDGTVTPPSVVAPPKPTIKKTVFAGGQFLMLKKLAFRRQLTIYRWQTKEQTAGVTQMTYTGGMYSIPQDKLAIFTHQKEGDNFEGVSMLRPAYKHWYYKETLYKIQAMAMQRQGMGIPQVTAPEDADEPSKQKARDALKNIRANESSYIEIPKGYIIDFMDMKGLSVIDCSHAIDHHDSQIMKNVLAGFLDLGKIKGSSGSHALSADQSRLFVQTLESIVQTLLDTVNNQIIKRLIDYNFNTDVYPKLTCGSLADDDIENLAVALKQLADADLLTPDAELENFLRETFKLPALPDDIKNDYNNRLRAQNPMVPDPRDPAALDDGSGKSVDASEIVELAERFKSRIGQNIDAITK